MARIGARGGGSGTDDGSDSTETDDTDTSSTNTTSTSTTTDTTRDRIRRVKRQQRRRRSSSSTDLSSEPSSDPPSSTSGDSETESEPSSSPSGTTDTRDQIERVKRRQRQAEREQRQQSGPPSDTSDQRSGSGSETGTDTRRRGSGQDMSPQDRIRRVKRQQRRRGAGTAVGGPPGSEPADDPEPTSPAATPDDSREQLRGAIETQRRRRRDTTSAERAEASAEQTELEERVAEQTDLSTDEIRYVERTDEGLQPRLTDEARRDRAREQFEERRRTQEELGSMAGEAAEEAVPLSEFNIDEVDFRSTGDGVQIRVSEEAVRERARDQFLEQNPGFEEDELVVSETSDGRIRVRPTEQAVQERTGTEQFVPEDVDPGPVATVVGEAGQALRDRSPMLDLGLTFGSATLSTRSGIPVSTEEGGLPVNREIRAPGQNDVDAVVETLEPAAQQFDAGAETVGSVVTTPLRVGAEETQTGPAEVAIDPSRALYTDTGSQAVQEGVTSGLKMLNPARVGQDAARFAEFEIQAADAATNENAPENLQRAGETTANVGSFVAEEGPGMAVSATIEDPARTLSVPIAGGTALIVGGGVGAGSRIAARGGARAGATVARRVTDVGDISLSSARRAGRRLARSETRPSIRIERDPDAGLVEVEGQPFSQQASEALPSIRSGGSRLPSRQGVTDRTFRTLDRTSDRASSLRTDLRYSAGEGVRVVRDAPRMAGQRVDLAARRTARTASDAATNARIFARDAGSRVANAPSAAANRTRIAAERARLGGLRRLRDLSEFRSDVSFALSETAGRVRAAPRLAGQRAELAGRRVGRRVSDFETDLRFSASQARARLEDASAPNPMAGLRSRRDGLDVDFDFNSPFLSDETTRGSPLGDFLPEADFGAARQRARLGGLRRLREASDVDTDIRFSLGEARERLTPNSAFLADESTRGPTLGQVLPSRSDVRSRTPSPSDATDSLRAARRRAGEYTVRIDRGGDRSEGPQTIDVEDLVGPDESAGTPTYRSFEAEDYEPGSNIRRTVTEESNIQSGGGQMMRIRGRQQQRLVSQGDSAQRLDELDTRTGRGRTRSRAGDASEGFAGAGAASAAIERLEGAQVSGVGVEEVTLSGVNPVQLNAITPRGVGLGEGTGQGVGETTISTTTPIYDQTLVPNQSTPPRFPPGSPPSSPRTPSAVLPDLDGSRVESEDVEWTASDDTFDSGIGDLDEILDTDQDDGEDSIFEL